MSTFCLTIIRQALYLPAPRLSPFATVRPRDLGAKAYCTFIGNELFVRQMHISEYRFGSYLNHPAKRDRKLLLNKRELHKLQNKIKERGFTIIPVMLFVNPQGRAKLLISLARGKKFYDKRESIKEKDTKRDMQRELRR